MPELAKLSNAIFSFKGLPQYQIEITEVYMPIDVWINIEKEKDPYKQGIIISNHAVDVFSKYCFRPKAERDQYIKFKRHEPNSNSNSGVSGQSQP